MLCKQSEGAVYCAVLSFVFVFGSLPFFPLIKIHTHNIPSGTHPTVDMMRMGLPVDLQCTF